MPGYLFEYWVDGEYILALDEEDAAHECFALWGHWPETVRQWTEFDQESEV